MTGGPTPAADLHPLAAAVLDAVDPRPLARRAAAEVGPVSAVLALGKAAAGLARGALEGLGKDPEALDSPLRGSDQQAEAMPGAPPPGLVLRPHTSLALFPDGTPPGGLEVGGWEEWPGGHPVPDVASFGAGRRLLHLGSELGEDDHLLALVSGGGSACAEVPAGTLSIVDLVATGEALIESALPIHAINAVRKHLSRVKGGRALAATAARVTVLVLSDVPGDDPAVVASGPFAADPSTYTEALEAVAGLELPTPVTRHLTRGAEGDLEETVKPGDPALARVRHQVLAGTADSARAAREWLEARGYQVKSGPLGGKAALAGAALVAGGRGLEGERVAVVLSGETTVDLASGDGEAGRGGRNQELALSAARALAVSGGPGRERVFALATDGDDGGTGEAGAVVDGNTWRRLDKAGIDAAAALARHDSHTALAELGDVLLTPDFAAPTGTNVADLAVYLRD